MEKLKHSNLKCNASPYCLILLATIPKIHIQLLRVVTDPKMHHPYVASTINYSEHESNGVFIVNFSLFIHNILLNVEFCTN